MVYVIGMNGLGLSPTTERKARILLKQGKAVIEMKTPFTIRLLYKTGCTTTVTHCGTDTGSQHIGKAVVSIKGDSAEVLSKEEYTMRSTMEKRSLIETRATYRKGRRYRKTRYRHPKFRPHTKRTYSETPVKRHGHETHWIKQKAEFTSSREEGWLPPSIQQKVDMTIRNVRTYMKILPPGTAHVIETARFDMARMQDPTVHGELYQYGPMYDHENVRAYVFDRDRYTCQVCRKSGKGVKLIAHHIDFRSKGATDNPKRMVTVCENCHTTKAHEPGGILYKWMVEGKEISRGLRDATFMNILRKRLFMEFPDARFTYGNITAADRKLLHVGKSHANDAAMAAIAGLGIKSIRNTEHTDYYIQRRKRKRSLHEATPRKGRMEPNKLAVRNSKNTKACTVRTKHKDPVTGKKVSVTRTFHLLDKVKVCGKSGWISGFTGLSAYVVDRNGKYIVPEGQNYSQISLSRMKQLENSNGWIRTAETAAEIG